MSYTPDLSTLSYHGGPIPLLIAIGWLEPPHPFPTGELSPGELARLRQITAAPFIPWPSFGRHECGFCGLSLTPYDYFIPHDGRLLTSPCGLEHYVTTHGYLPPDVWRQALMACPPMTSREYLTAFLATGILDLVAIAMTRLQRRQQPEVTTAALTAFIEEQWLEYVAGAADPHPTTQ